MGKTAIKSADDLIVNMENQKLGITAPPESKEVASPKIEEPIKAQEETTPVEDAKEPEKESHELIEKQDEKEPEPEPEKKESENVDEYGNEIQKPKFYSEEEVQNIIRKRLKEKHSQSTEQQRKDVQEAAKDFQADPNSEETWEVQLSQFIGKEFIKLRQQEQQAIEAERHKEWERKELATQEEFQEKFVSGINRYHDFENVVTGKRITEAMMIATRTMQDPSAFVYAACKNHAGELDRISKIIDPYAQIAEIGRLEERMKKGKSLTKSPAPAKKVLSDIQDNDKQRENIDDRIAQHAKSKIIYTGKDRR